jgi:cytochrome c oxidase cbb3-type subunit 3
MPAWETALGEAGVQEVTQYVLSLSNRASDKTQAEAGKGKFAMFCVACHGADGKGNVAFGAPNLTNDAWLYGGSPMMIARSIRSGRNGNMPAWDNLLGQERIHLLAAYVWSLSHKSEE